jgi:hypothetical protein
MAARPTEEKKVMTVDEIKAKIAAIEKGEGEGDIEALKKELADLEAKAKEGGEAPPTTPSEPPAPPAEPPKEQPKPEAAPPVPPPPAPVPPPPTTVTESPETAMLRALALELLQLQLSELPESARTMISEKSAGDPMKMRDLIMLARSMGPTSAAQPPAVNTAQPGGTSTTSAVTLDDIRAKAASGAYA